MADQNPIQNKPIKTWEPGNFPRQSTPNKIAQGSLLYGVYAIDTKTGTLRLFNVGARGDISKIVNELYKK
ncbi:MAG: hypothetical protein V1815_01365 [Candidatus Woesearchaeota archaeon]